jgi:spore maturation protein CgeB
MKVLCIHPGHSFSTSDVFDGLCAGLAMVGAQVVPFRWERILQVHGAIVAGALAAGTVKPENAEKVRQWTSWLGAADSISVAVDEGVDAAIVVNGILFPMDRAHVLQKLGIPVACIGTEAPYFLKAEQDFSAAYTHWFTNERRCVSAFDVPTFYLQHAYNPALHRPSPPDPAYFSDVAFIGGGYPERRQLLDAIDWAGVHLEKHGTLWHLDLEQERLATDIGRSSRYSEGAIPNTETSAWHRNAKVALNMNRLMTHVETGQSIAAGSAESLGPRAYEIPAVGGFMLSDDDRPELHDIYGDSAATFRAWDASDLSRALRYWLRHDDARERVQAAQYEAVRPHHWGNRASYILERIIN